MLQLAPSSPSVVPSPLRFRAQRRIHRGLVRDRNEDAVLAEDRLRFWAVADGVGGHERGGEASAALVEELAHCLDDVAPSAMPSATVHAIERASARLHRRLRTEGRRSGGATIATTLAAATSTGSIAVILWAGDSRVYHQRGERCTLLTRDHVVAGGALSRAIGAGEHCALDTAVVGLQPHDRLLLCTDGLTKEVPEPDLVDLLRSEPRLVRCADRLLATALERGGRDNIGLVLVEAL
jgi:serine/threonine protein phosphatase PrpC